MSRLAWSLLIFMCKFLAVLMLLQVETISEHVEDKFQAISINKVSFSRQFPGYERDEKLKTRCGLHYKSNQTRK
jgi:hypothetical protein